MKNKEQQKLTCDEFEFRLLGGGEAEITGYSGGEAAVAVPDLIGDGQGGFCSVKVIGRSAFACHEEITRLRLPRSLRKIGAKAFEGCSRLEWMRIPDSVKVIGAQGEADAMRIQAQAQADAYRMQAEAEAQEMRMKGYTYQQETTRQVATEAVKNGGAGGLAGDVTGVLGGAMQLGLGLGAAGSVIGMTKDALGAMNAAVPQAPAATDDGWTCEGCGCTGNTTNFCPNCGRRRPEAGWTCPGCGQAGITTNFCPNCGRRRPEAGWTCPGCGLTGITTNFCPNCGAKKGEKGDVEG